LRQIDVHRFFDRLTVVGSFQRRQLGRVLFDELGEFVKQPATISRAKLGPLSFKSATGSSDCLVDVCLVGLRDLGEYFASSGVRRVECFS
jgi:hypothetical protein